ncbi:ankyrin repeat-containing protein [Curvularia clavata]|uniref:Ankyrin repeat-containing protein n=1 Tax=Curvularia clavata TaxID=95742 RepID=A0A9Q8Z5C1_CURCL|nr:ankyrin repeat-containing protein [Curvularia clavata]
MGQGQSQQTSTYQAPELEVSDEERAKNQAEMRAQQQAALDKRLAKQPRRASPTAAPARRKPSALEQASRENVGWRNADAQAELRSWN